MSQVNPEELLRLQADRLEELRRLQATDPERAKREARERLVSAGLIGWDGRPAPPYA